MQSQQTDQKTHLIVQLLGFGFDQKLINQALQYTKNKQVAAEIILKLAQNPKADLSQYLHMNKIIEQPKIQYQISQPKMLFVVNGELKMGKGKICAQVGHAVIGAYIQIEEQSRFDERSNHRLKTWQNLGSAKIVVKSETEAEMMNIQKKIQQLKDQGRTQIKSGSRTVLAIGPAFAHEIDPVTQHLKLL